MLGLQARLPRPLLEAEGTPLSQDGALWRSKRALWTGLGVAVIMLMGVSAIALHPIDSQASVGPSHELAFAYGPMLPKGGQRTTGGRQTDIRMQGYNGGYGQNYNGGYGQNYNGGHRQNYYGNGNGNGYGRGGVVPGNYGPRYLPSVYERTDTAGQVRARNQNRRQAPGYGQPMDAWGSGYDGPNGARRTPYEQSRNGGNRDGMARAYHREMRYGGGYGGYGGYGQGRYMPRNGYGGQGGYGGYGQGGYMPRNGYGGYGGQGGYGGYGDYGMGGSISGHR